MTSFGLGCVHLLHTLFRVIWENWEWGNRFLFVCIKSHTVHSGRLVDDFLPTWSGKTPVLKQATFKTRSFKCALNSHCTNVFSPVHPDRHAPGGSEGFPEKKDTQYVKPKLCIDKTIGFKVLKLAFILSHRISIFGGRFLY